MKIVSCGRGGGGGRGGVVVRGVVLELELGVVGREAAAMDADRPV